MSDNEKTNAIPTAILQEFPDGTRMVEVPNTSGTPSMAAGHDFVAIVGTDGRVSRLMMNFDVAKVRKYADWLAKHGVMSREATADELDAIVKGVASKMHGLIDSFNGSVAKALLQEIGTNVPEDPEKDPGELEDILRSICFDKLVKSARESGLRKGAELNVHKKIRDLLIERVTLESLNIPEGISSVDGIRDLVDAEDTAREVRDICKQILDEAMPEGDHSAGALFNFIEDMIETYAVPEGNLTDENKAKCLQEIEDIVYPGVESKDSDLGPAIISVLEKYGIGGDIEGMDIEIHDNP